KPRRHQTAIRDQAVARSRATTALSPPLSGGHWKRCVPETSPCHVQAKQNGELDLRKVACFCREHSPRNRDRDKLIIGNQQRIGSVRNRLGTWAASAGSSRSKFPVTGAAANPS